MNTIKRSSQSTMFQGPEPPKRTKGGIECHWFMPKNLAVEEFGMQINPELLMLQDLCKLVEGDKRHGNVMPHQIFVCSGRSHHLGEHDATILNEVPQGTKEGPDRECTIWIMFLEKITFQVC